jgi:hypothetical protein
MNLAVVRTSSAVLKRSMEQRRTVIVHRLAEAVAALAEAQATGGGVVLVSAPGAALHAGCGWWRALVAAARASHPAVECTDVLDCADGAGQAMAALRIGLTRLVLWPDAPGRAAVCSIAESMGGFVLPAPPPTDRRESPRTARSPDTTGAGDGSEQRGRGNGDKTRSPG